MRTVDTEPPVVDAAPRPPVRRLAVAAVAALALLVAVGVPALWLGGGDDAGPAAPDGFGTWSPLPDAPIRSRPYAVAAWTGTEAVFWAGASLDRGHAFTDGAAYDPAAGAWRTLAVPGWGHPGLSGVFVDGALHVTAKGGLTRLDVRDGTTAVLPEPPGFVVVGVAAADGALWALGPARYEPNVPAEVGIARYDDDAGGWAAGVTITAALDADALFRALETQPVLWTGREIVLWWYPVGGGLAYDPAARAWRQIAPPAPPDGVVTASRAAVAGGELVAVAAVSGAGEPSLWVAREIEGAWAWQDLGLPPGDLAAATVAGTPEWLVALLPGQVPLTYHVASGAWSQHAGAPLAGLAAPSAVWAGDRLLVWGGTAPEGTAPSAAHGAAWTPPG